MAITTLTRDIAPGEVYRSKESVRLEGSIGAGAQVTIEDGGLLVTGAVADDVKIETKNQSSSISIGGGSVIIGDSSIGSISIGNVSGGNITMVGNKVIVDGVDVTSQFNGKATDPQLSGIVVQGTVGTNVELHSSSGIELKQAAGDTLKAKAGNGFEGVNVGAGAVLKAGNGVHLQNLGAQSRVRAGNGAHIAFIGEGCQVDAGNSVHATYIGANAEVDAGNSIKADSAHRSAELAAGNKVKVDRYVDGTAPNTGFKL
jgi:hypothetical protein